MLSLQAKIQSELEDLPLISQKEVLDFVLFLKSKILEETDTEFLSKNPQIKQTIIDGLQTPLSKCSETLDW